jgi:hypothetical protein
MYIAEIHNKLAYTYCRAIAFLGPGTRNILQSGKLSRHYDQNPCVSWLFSCNTPAISDLAVITHDRSLVS